MSIVPVNTVVGDCLEIMRQMPSGSVDLIVTSPPYNVGKDYGGSCNDSLPQAEYERFLAERLSECYRILKPDGRICINVPEGTSRKPYYPLDVVVTNIMLKIGFLFRGKIVWYKGEIYGNMTAWGSWCSPSDPVLRGLSEYVIVASKTEYAKEPRGRGDMTPREFMEYTRNIWCFPPASAHQVGHPAPFPPELPKRCIKLFTYPGDLVFDPFMGIGTTCLAAKELGRRYFGCDINPDYVAVTRRRLRSPITLADFSVMAEEASG